MSLSFEASVKSPVRTGDNSARFKLRGRGQQDVGGLDGQTLSIVLLPGRRDREKVYSTRQLSITGNTSEREVDSRSGSEQHGPEAPTLLWC
ncbi:hypothetical protein BaRGS_00021537 [Batillaria attramentaria]|uniref:Uncharacterized protein n=1 Tax=Batillaria attramentaria TaxID=370345 RepID=A0ABD0KJ15_9CAEN